MQEYEPLDSAVEVNGQTILSVVHAFPEGLRSHGERILAENGIDDPEEDEWYPQEHWLESFNDLHEQMGESTLAQIGKKIPRSAEWPPGTNTIVDGVESIDTAYHMNHRGGEIGNYDAEQAGAETIYVVCDNPYPCAFDVGILEGVVDEFGETRASINEIGTECRADGGDECQYEITW